MEQVTLKQIAEYLGISIATVSKALKDYPDVSEKTKALVKAEAERLNYQPNSFAVNLRTRESKTIGLIIPEVVHFFFGNIVQAIITQAEMKGYLVIILQSDDNPELEKKQIDLPQFVFSIPFSFLTFPVYSKGDRKNEKGIEKTN